MAEQAARLRRASQALRLPPVRTGLAAGGWVVLAVFWALAPAAGFDARNYWSLDLSYSTTWHEPGSFVYSPAAGQALAPLTLLPFEVFAKLLLAVNLCCLVWLVGPFWAAFSLAILPVTSELLTGQIHLPLAVALVVGMSRSAAWAPILLTKVTPGVALVWFAVRREWRQLGVAVGATAAIIAVSVLIDHQAWIRWIAFLQTPHPPPDYTLTLYPVEARLGAAVVLTGLAAWRNCPAALPLIVLAALPAVWFTALVLLAAIPRLSRAQVSQPAPANQRAIPS